MKTICKYTPELILLIYILFFLCFKHPRKDWDRIINSDGKGYYAYLPAIFIYHDLQFRFVEQYESKYYPSNRSVFKEFRNQEEGHTVNKYFPGLAIVWLPFFLFAHFMAWLRGSPMDGYSLTYQYSIALSALLFLYFGSRWLKKLLLSFGSGDKVASLIVFAVTLGTNLIFFTIVEPSMTHVYSFALITGFLLASYKLFHDYRGKWFAVSLFFLILIVLIRPTNVLIILLLPFLAGSRDNMLQTTRKVWQEKKTLFSGILLALILLTIPVVLWHLQSGKWFVYTYGNEKLNFLHPQIFRILFDYNRGWFVYTPLAFISLLGFPGLLKQDRFRFLWLLIFLLGYIYVTSCWWVWYYASKCGQRVFIDIYPVIALLLLYTFRLSIAGTWKRLISGFIILLIMLNIIQFYQHTQWIFPPYNINKSIFWDSFFSLTKQAKVYLPGEAIVAKKSFTNDMEENKGPTWLNPNTRNGSEYHEGHWSSLADQTFPYSAGLEVCPDSLFITGNRLIRIEAYFLTSERTTESSLVVDYEMGGKSLSYNALNLDKYNRKDRWTKMEAAFYVPRKMPQKGSVKIYFYNPSPVSKLFIDDLKIEFISLKDEPDYRKIEGVLLPDEIR
ncbi:MAG: hypothetical protein M0Q38_06785 [Bacteroidales bacterium]|jgi:hypothetical protein|nr:hypothetical protein [Bacteroidales bacterium]